MSEFEHTRVIPAEPGVVFDIASGEPTLNSWTPEGVEVEPAGRGALHAWIAEGSEIHDAFGYVDVDRDRLRMEWGGTESGYDGWLQVVPDDGTADATGAESAEGADSAGRADGTGGSVATLHLTFTDEGAALGGERGEEADRRVEQALDRLAALVRERTGG
ncbi:SRPBCC family protein [Saccharomonospora saliphila]|uniref:SRPBCC family protein n=1 Tax=Saccharomonospora saliphila TaxID=369829 RepID=UPI00037C3D81|nr:SRPBCC family protein [Saccharomonospora saliphila]